MDKTDPFKRRPSFVFMPVVERRFMGLWLLWSHPKDHIVSGRAGDLSCDPWISRPERERCPPVFHYIISTKTKLKNIQ
jgi:hypothetical protein